MYEWAGNSDAGVGRITIAESIPSSKIVMNLDFVEPMDAHNIVEFTLQPSGDTTTVTWAMHGHTPYFAKVIHVFFNMDKTVGTDFETCLASLKAIAER